MQKNYLFLNLMVLLIGMTFGGFALQPSMAATGYTPTVTDDEITVFLETSFDNAKVWAWNDNPQLTTAGWPGDAMTLMGKAANGKNIFKWTYTGDKGAPTAIIFTHDGGHKLNGGDQEYVNHGYYVEGAYTKTIEARTGKVMAFFDNTTHDLTDVFCFIYNGTTAAEQWPGLKMTFDAKASFNGKTGFFTVEVPCESIQFTGIGSEMPPSRYILPFSFTGLAASGREADARIHSTSSLSPILHS